MSGDDPEAKNYFYDSEDPQSPRPRGREAPPSSLVKPRLKHASTSAHGTPSGSTYAPPRPDPLPARGAGVLLLLNAASAAIALIFAVLLAIKI